MNKRRIVIRSVSAAVVMSVAGIPLKVFSQVSKLNPNDPQAVSLGYTDDSTAVDKTKYPSHDPSQVCSACQFYQTAQESAKIAPCTIFGGKGVAAGGWCSAYLAKAA